MNDSDFDNIFNEKMNEVPNFPQKKEGWQKVAATLNNKPFSSPQPANTRWWWLPFLLLLLGWNIWQTGALHKASANSLTLVETIQNLEKRFLEKQDTLFTSRITYHTDTIYKTIYIIEKNKGYSDYSVNQSSFLSQYSTPKSLKNTDIEPNDAPDTILKNKLENDNSYKITSKTDKSSIITKKSDISDVQKAQSNSITEKNDIVAKKTEIAAIKEDSTHQNPPPQYAEGEKESLIENKPINEALAKIEKNSVKDTLENFENKLTNITNESKKEPIIQKMPKIHIKEVQLGIQSGVSDLLPHQKDISLSQWMGISSSVAFSNHLRLTSTVDIISLNFKVNNRPQNLEPLNLPLEPTPSSDYVLRYIEGENKSWQMGLGANYILTPTKPIRTYLSAGYMRRSIISSEAEFEYLNSITGEEISFKGENTAKHIDNWWYIGLGSEVKIYHNIGIKLEASYIHDFNKTENTLRYWVLRGGVFLKFR